MLWGFMGGDFLLGWVFLSGRSGGATPVLTPLIYMLGENQCKLLDGSENCCQTVLKEQCVSSLMLEDWQWLS